jgi:hypothetical protein
MNVKIKSSMKHTPNFAEPTSKAYNLDSEGSFQETPRKEILTRTVNKVKKLNLMKQIQEMASLPPIKESDDETFKVFQQHSHRLKPLSMKEGTSPDSLQQILI